MTGDHPTDWASKYVKAAALREAADDLLDDDPLSAFARLYLHNRAREIEQA